MNPRFTTSEIEQTKLICALFYFPNKNKVICKCIICKFLATVITIKSFRF